MQKPTKLMSLRSACSYNPKTYKLFRLNNKSIKLKCQKQYAYLETASLGVHGTMRKEGGLPD